MTVLIVVTSANKKTGFGTSTYNEQQIGLAKALIKQGFHCGIAYYGGNQEKYGEYDVGVGTIKMYLLKGKDFLTIAVFKNYDSLFNEYDILMPISYDHYETYHLAMRYPEKTVVYHGTYYSPFNKRYNFKCKVLDKLMLPGYKKTDTMFVTKNKLAADFLNKKGLQNTKIIGVGFDVDQMEGGQLLQSELSSEIRKAKEEHYKILLYVGRIEPRRNTSFLLEVFTEVLKLSKTKLVIVGNGSEKYKKKCMALAKERSITDYIIYQEKLEQKYLPQIYNLADLFLLPTSYEIFGMVILEAMYFGIPVLTTENGGSDILIENEKSGYIIPELDIIRWANKCFEILNSDTTVLSAAAHRRIVDDFTWDALVDKFIVAYKTKLEKT